ncbi:hypothetical protein B0H10DRAFT_807757 [Mycena sp. CBHHK59/15]|nr:hypothetical protein B0H10DRAFT_807757 [Mycena sp. CBHHK59/15]
MQEVSDMMPSKTPERSGRSGTRPQLRQKKGKSDKAKGKRKQRSLSRDRELSDTAPARKISGTATVEAVTDDGDVPSSSQTHAQPRTEKTRNPIYHFYELTTLNGYGKPGDPGDKHYKCCHGSGKVITVKKTQKRSVNGLVSHLARKVPQMYRLYEILKDHMTPPTADELDITSGKKLEAASNSILTAFRKQVAVKAQWDEAVLKSS